MTTTANDRRLIEDYLPLDVLNAISGKDKKHPKHPASLIHYWPARRPITACRAAIYATLVPAPGTDFERKEADAFVTKLAAFEPGAKVLSEAKDRILKQYGGVAPKILDMFAGGGAIPLEASRLGCESHALDYNPVAHLIELCTLVYPQKYGPSLADDFEHWSQVVLDRMRQELRAFYPPVQIPGTKEVLDQTNLFGGSNPQAAPGVEPVAYIWARTVPCRRPGCEAPVPLVRQAWLRKRGGAVAAVPRIENGSDLQWEIVTGSSAKEVGAQESQTGAGQAVCIACNTPVPSDYVKEMALAGKMHESLAAVVVQGPRSKLYLAPQAGMLPPENQLHSLLVALEEELGFGALGEVLQGKLRDQLPNYGFENYQNLFTPRQLFALFTLVKQIQTVHAEMLDEGMNEDRARALTTYFAMAFGRLANSFTKFCRWESKGQITIAALGDRQAMKMVYDYSEMNPVARTAGCLQYAFDNEVYCVRNLARITNPAVVTRGNAEKLFYDDETFDAVITDPPYYSSIYYADLSSFFYVWLKRIVGDLFPEHFALPTPPKRREAVAQPSEHGRE